MRYLFKHILMRDAVYDMQLRRRLDRLHHRAAQAIEALYADSLPPHYADLAYHYEQAGVEQKAIDYHHKAGDYARENYAIEEAIGHYRRALSVLETAVIPPFSPLYEQKIALYEGLGKVLWQHADLAESTAVYEQMRLTAEAAGDAATQARAWNGLCQVHESAGDHHAVLKDARHAEEMAEQAGDAALLSTALINQGFASFRLGNMGQTLALGEQAMRLAEESDVGQVIISALHLLGGAYDLLGAYDRAVQYQEQALALCRKQEDLYRIAGSLNNIGENARLRGDYETAVSYFQEALALSRKVGARNGAMVIRASMGGARAGLGQYKAAERDLRQVIETSRAVGGRFARMYAYLFLAEALLGQGEMGQALAAARRALALGEETGLQECIGGAWRTLGMIAAARRQPVVVADEEVDAAVCFRRSVQVFTEMGALGERKRTLEVWRQSDPDSVDAAL